MDSLLQRLTGLATASIPLAARERTAPHAPDRPAFRVSPAARSFARGALWIVLLILPGSFLFLPLLFWWRTRRSAMSDTGSCAAEANFTGLRLSRAIAWRLSGLVQTGLIVGLRERCR